MAFPPAHMLVGAGVAEVVRAGQRHPPRRMLAWSVGAMLGALPDVDIVLGILLGRGGDYHGTFTHSLTLAVAAGAVAWMLAGWRWGVLAGATYLSHLLVDLLDDRGRTNVLLLWPFTDEQPYAIARIFPTVAFAQGEGPIGAALSLFRPDVLGQLLLQTAYGAGFFALLLLLAALVRRARVSVRAA